MKVIRLNVNWTLKFVAFVRKVSRARTRRVAKIQNYIEDSQKRSDDEPVQCNNLVVRSRALQIAEMRLGACTLFLDINFYPAIDDIVTENLRLALAAPTSIVVTTHMILNSRRLSTPIIPISRML